MRDYFSFPNRRSRRVLIASAIVGLAAVGISHIGRPVLQDIALPSQRAHSVEAVRERPAPMLAPSAAAFDTAATGDPSRSGARFVYVPPLVASQATPVPFKLLGKVQEGGASTLLLYRGGQLLSIRNGMPLDEDYVVDALTEDYVVLRQRSNNESQIIQLAARQEAAASEWKETAPD